MRYYIEIAGRTHEVELRADAVLVDGEQVSAELQHLPNTLMRRLSCNGASHAVVATPGDTRGAWRIAVNGEVMTAEVVDERTRAIRAMTGADKKAHGPKPIRAPMPGMIVRVEVEVGQTVAAGQGVVIIEAMKMENELKAEAAGVIAKISATPGAAVEKGAVLIEFAVNDGG